MIRRTIITGSLVIVLIAAVIAGITVYGEGDVPQAEQNIYNNMGQINALVESKKIFVDDGFMYDKFMFKYSWN